MILTKIFLQNLVNQETSKFSQLMFEGDSTLFFAIKWYFYLDQIHALHIIHFNDIINTIIK